jgi:hypothetical protein
VKLEKIPSLIICGGNIGVRRRKKKNREDKGIC